MNVVAWTLRIVCALLLALPAALMHMSAARAAAEPVAPISCLQAGAEAEQAWSVPPGLLTAIGRVESGRFDAMSGRLQAWPWSINAAGTDYVFDSRDAAIQAVRALQMRGVRSIDVGCFQINLMYHPDAFASLEEAFDSRANAAYAAKFLRVLQARGGSWELAVAWYHSATPGLGEAYRDRVMASLGGAESGATSAMRTDAYVISVAAATYSARLPTRASVFIVSARAFGVRIWTPGVAPSRTLPIAATRTLPAHPIPRVGAASARSGLPRIVTPTSL